MILVILNSMFQYGSSFTKFYSLENKIVINTEKFKIHQWEQKSDNYSKIGEAVPWCYRSNMLSDDILCT